ncbi:MAG: protein translocase subunit SecD [Phycisphaerae bacterium]|nr:protein translocase subunit SecD [Phycisphaerae bacterium]
MIDNNFWWKVLLIGVLLGLAVSQLYPPSQRLKGGIDLMGGHSLLYEIDDTGIPADRRRDLSERVMAILKERVDPKGQRNLVWRPMGSNRLEIQIPKPPEQVVKAREDYQKVRGELAVTELSRNQIRVALERQGDQRGKALQGLVRGVTAREKLLEPLTKAYDNWRQIHEKTPDTDADVEAREAYEKLEGDLLKTNINVEQVEDILAMGKGEARQKELDRFYESHPSLKETLERLVAAYDPWADQRGALDDPADLKRLLMGAGVLEFRILPTRDPQNPDRYNEYIRNLAKRGPRMREGDQFGWFEIKNPGDFLHMKGLKDFDAEFQKRKETLNFIVEKYADKYYVLASNRPDETMLAPRGKKGAARWSMESARASRDPQTNQPCVLFGLDDRGGNLMEAVSRANQKRPLCIMLDDVAISAPILQSVIRKNGQITGDFTVDDVQYLVNKLEAGSLPARLKPTPIMEKSIGPSLGLTNRSKGLKAAIVGMVSVAVFMLIYYLYAGFLADVAVMMNLILTLGIMAMLQATFTLPGIAGLILTIGMAVDANVLIYERIREESLRGSGLRTAVKAGYEKALSTILDANVTTLITCVILGYVGSDEVKGFAYTLGFGVATSMFTALFVTRQFFNLMLAERVDRQAIMFPLYGVGGLLAIGGVLYGLSLVLANPDSVAAIMGEFFALCGGVSAIVFALMWVCRLVLRGTLGKTPKSLPMLRLIGRPKIDWMSKRYIFWPVSAALVFSGLAFFVYQDHYHGDDLYSIEFLGGTAAQIEVKKDSPLLKDKLNQDEIIRKAITGDEPTDAAGWLRTVADELDQGDVKQGTSPSEFLISAKNLTARQIESFLLAVFEDKLERRDSEAPSGSVLSVQAKPGVDLDAVQNALRQAAVYARQASGKVRQAGVQVVELAVQPGQEEPGPTFEVTTTETSSRVVREAIVAALGDQLVIQPAVSLTVYENKDPKADEQDPTRLGLFPVEKATLGEVLRDPKAAGIAAARDVSRFNGGVAFVLKDMSPAISRAAIVQRLRQMRLQPDFEAYAWREFEVIPLAQNPAGECTSAAIVVTDEHYRYDESAKVWRESLAQPELALAKAALETGKSLQKVTRFSPSVARQSKTRALAAVVLALAVIVGYIWLRFGSMTFGLCAIAALVHDVAISVGLVALSHFIYGSFVGRAFAITDFRIDLSMIAAFLTIIGYSLNDTIVVFDRIRENRGKLATIDDRMVTDSVNQTLSRTLLTSLTTLFVVLVMYVFGGPGIHGFNYALLVGIIVGTYSSIGIAGALLVSPTALRIFYYVLGAAVMSIVMVALSAQSEGLLVVAGAALLLAVLVLGELTAWRSAPMPPREVWTAAFGWSAVVVAVWLVTIVIGTLATSTADVMVWIRGLAALGAALYGAYKVFKAINELKPAPGRATA